MARIYDATWGRAFAALYDWGLRSTEEAGLHGMRTGLLAEARGRVLELGAGTGVNVELYPEAVEELVLVEPDPHMAKRLRARTAQSGREATIVEASAEDLPFEGDRFDTAVATLVFCTIPDPERALSELGRVLKPGGRLLFIEHVRSRDPRLAAWQDRLERPWRFLGDGCHCNRDTVATISASSLRLGEVEHDRLPKSPPIVRPLVRGSATR
ncbi:MAG TPA: class I SAM-dependent methyltransferase [Solirubrobacterales bacterium]|jgi:SAM-dependent methyltransferase